MHLHLEVLRLRHLKRSLFLSFKIQFLSSGRGRSCDPHSSVFYVNQRLYKLPSIFVTTELLQYADSVHLNPLN